MNELQRNKDNLRIAMQFANLLRFSDLLILEKHVIEKITERHLQEIDFNPYKLKRHG